MTQDGKVLERAGTELGPVIGHWFDIITETEPGVPSPVEALSGDHMVGLYRDIAPRKMREQRTGFVQITPEDLRPKAENVDGGDTLYLEAVSMRKSRFFAADLQYIEENWLAMVDEVKYGAREVLGSAWLMKHTFGKVFIYLNTRLPMPLWIRPVPLDAGLQADMFQIVIQGRSLNAPIFTNIHTEVSMVWARQWAKAVHGYYKKVED